MYYNLPPEERSLSHGYNPMCEAFPRIASCDYVRYGTGGAQENRSAICILGLNMINDKVSKLQWSKFTWIVLNNCNTVKSFSPKLYSQYRVHYAPETFKMWS